MTSSALTALAALVVAVPVAAPAAATAETWPHKRVAHRLAVKVAAGACAERAWCQASEVVAAHRCRRAAHGTVYCGIVFITALRQRCGGVVGVSQDHRGRLAAVMAVPYDCSGAAIRSGRTHAGADPPREA